MRLQVKFQQLIKKRACPTSSEPLNSIAAFHATIKKSSERTACPTTNPHQTHAAECGQHLSSSNKN